MVAGGAWCASTESAASFGAGSGASTAGAAEAELIGTGSSAASEVRSVRPEQATLASNQTKTTRLKRRERPARGLRRGQRAS